MQIKASEIASYLNYVLVGPDITITSIIQLSDISTVTTHALVFAKKFSFEILDLLNKNLNLFVIAHSDYAGKLLTSHIISAKPRLDFARVLTHFINPSSYNSNGVLQSSLAKISSLADVHPSVIIGDYVVIEDHASIAAGTIIGHHSVIRYGVQIGEECYIKSHAVIGEESFGFELDEDGIPFRIPHIGSVKIGNNVGIGSFTTITRGTLGLTLIADNVKMDGHVYIAHNVEIGENTMIGPSVEISGSVKIGRDVWIAPQVTIMNGIAIGAHAFLGLGAVILNSVEPNAVMVGNPAKRLRYR